MASIEEWAEVARNLIKANRDSFGNEGYQLLGGIPEYLPLPDPSMVSTVGGQIFPLLKYVLRGTPDDY